MADKKPKKKPVRRNVSDVKAAPPRSLRPSSSGAPDPDRGHVAYPSAAELVRSPEWKAWLESALRSVLTPAALASAVGLAAAGCGDLPSVDGILGQEPTPAPVFYGSAPPPLEAKPAVVFAPIGSPTNPQIVIASPLPEDKIPTLPTLPTSTTSIEPCPLPTFTTHRLPGRAPAPHLRPPVAPIASRGGAAVVHVPPLPPPPIVPAVDPPQIDGDIAVVHPEPEVPMPGGMRPVMAEDE